tara:strand:- start:513 stop:1148 length:636 start_codon:yes stop_codon:yes gene_type:complete
MIKKHKIVMLPTEDNSLLGVHNRKGLLYAKNEGWCYIVKHDYIQPQHLYILSDDEIKEGDWIYDGVINEVHKVFHDTSVIGQDRKIIATNDPKLTKVDEISGENVWTSLIPQIPQSFIEYYAKHQPEYVEMEYECINKLKLVNNEIVWVEPDNELNLATNKFYMERAMKVPVSVEEKLYTREELEGFAFHTAQICQGMNDLEIEQWIKENL